MAVRSLNSAQVIGNITADPQIRSTNNGTAVATFAVATNREYTTSEGDYQEAADFHNVVAFGKLAEICQNLLQKGSMVYIKGRLQTRTWDDDSGKKNYRTEIVAEDMILLARGKPMAEGASQGSGSRSDSSSSTNVGGGITVTDDIPDEDSAPKKKDVKKEEQVDADDIPF